jgi:hypothetical protein
MTVDNDLDSLAEPFKSKAYLLVEAVARAGLPFVVFETRRSFSRTQELYMKGRALKNGNIVIVDPRKVVSRAEAGSSPHNWGLALDCILDLNSDWWEDEKPTGQWDNGFEKGKRARPTVIMAWERYGKTVRSLGLTWGGDFASLVDLPHAELLGWRQHRPGNWKEVAKREVLLGK